MGSSLLLSYTHTTYTHTLLRQSSLPFIITTYHDVRGTFRRVRTLQLRSGEGNEFWSQWKTNKHNPGGHERKIVTKLMNAEKNNQTRMAASVGGSSKSLKQEGRVNIS